ncbi:MAG TPA: hypothetical protein VK824_11530, partial [Planctomycetota bacterium]|nr:hypothetical protein [Planctomycetota bacterium]
HAALTLLRQGLPLEDARVAGVLSLREIMDQQDAIKHPVVIRRCVLEKLWTSFVMFEAPVVLEDVDVEGTSELDGCFFPTGFSAVRCRFKGGFRMCWGGHNSNGAEFRFEDCEFDGFANFEDEWFMGPVVVRGCAFRGGANLLALKGDPWAVRFDVAPLIESNTGRMDESEAAHPDR